MPLEGPLLVVGGRGRVSLSFSHLGHLHASTGVAMAPPKVPYLSHGASITDWPIGLSFSCLDGGPMNYMKTANLRNLVKV